MNNVVRLVSKPRPSKGAQTGTCRTSIQMADMLGDIAGMEGHGGCPVAGLNAGTLGALRRRGLVADYECHGARVCLSPVGRNVLRGWRSRV